MGILRAFFGLLFLVGVAWLFSKEKKSINWRLVIGGLLLQTTFGFLITQIDVVSTGFQYISKFFVYLGFLFTIDLNARIY